MPTTISDPTGLRWCAYHKTDHAETAFSGYNRYCRAGLNEYRRLKREEKQKANEAKIADGAPACKTCKTRPVQRKNADRCPTCIKAKRHRCGCGRISHHPVCGKCRWRRHLAAEDEKQRRTLERGFKVVMGDARCAKCGVQLPRDPAGNPVLKHECRT